MEEEGLEDAIYGAYALSLLGLNVTVPHKSACMKYLKDIDPLAKKIGAVNTLVRVEGGYKGYNTDMPGLLRAMEHDGVDIKGKDVIILGAGGVARAVSILMTSSGAKHTYILNRTLSKAQAIVSEIEEDESLKGRISAMDIRDYKDLPGEDYICIQATNVGMHPDTDSAVIEDPEFYKKVSFGYDLVYNPLETKFMKLCKNAGAGAFCGLRMLLYQGVIAFEYWTGHSVSDELAEKVYGKMIEYMNEQR